MPPARAPLLALLVLLILPGRVAAARPVDGVGRAYAVAESHGSRALSPGIGAPLDALGLRADGSASRSGASGAIGPDHYVEAVNHRIAVFDRTGAPVNGRPLEDFTSGARVEDPQVQWDPQQRRWLFVATGAAADGSNQIFFGYSRTQDPSDLTAGWCPYQIATDVAFGGTPGSGDRETDPHLGHDDGHVLMTTNAFLPSGFLTARLIFYTPQLLASGACAHSQVYSLIGTAETPIRTRRGHLARSLVPADVQDSSASAPIVAADFDPTTGRGNALQLWHIVYGKISGEIDGLATDAEPAVRQPFTAPSDALQPVPAPRLDTGDGHLSHAVAHADPAAGGATAVWTAHAVAGPNSRSVVRWYELIPARGEIRQVGEVSAPRESFFSPAISPTSGGDAAVLLVNASGADAYPSVRSFARTPMTRRGFLEDPTTLHRSTSATLCESPVCPWSPGTAATPDPRSSSTVWGTVQLAGMPDGVKPAWITRNVALIADVAAPRITLISPGRFVRRGVPVRARYSCADEPGGSGLTSCVGSRPRGARLDNRVGRHRFTVRARDRAGHVTVLSRTYLVDGRRPVVTVRAPRRNVVLRRRARVVAHYSCSDERGGSGVASCRGTVRAGRPLDTSRPGRRALVVVATDRAGHRVRVVRPYRVG